MKLIFVLFAVIGLSFAAPTTRSLRTDFDEILALIPKDKIKEIYHEYENDPDIKLVVAYLKSENFAKVVHIVAQVEEVKQLVDYLESKNIHAIDFLNRIADILGLPHWPSGFSVNAWPDQTRTWRDFMNAVAAVIPMKDLEALIFDKLSNSEDFQELYEKIASVDYKRLKEEALSHPEIVDLINRLKGMGVDIQKIIDFLKEFFGWEYKGYSIRSSRSLRTDLDELLALIPKDRIKEIYHEYENDPDIKKIVAYLKSKDFAAVVHIVAQVDEVKRLVNYLESKDIHIIDFLNKIADILGLPHWPGSFYIGAWPAQTRTWRDFMNAVIAVLPMKDIEALIFDKLSNSEDFQELYEKIASIDYKGLKEQALSHPEIVDLINRLKNMGVDIQKIIDFLKEFFGWEYKGYSMRNNRSLRTDFDEILALIPKDRIKEIYHEYENDPDIKKIVAYLKSKDFASVVHIVAQVDEVKRLVNYLESKDIHVIDFLNKIADILGLPHWPGSFYIGAWPAHTRSWRNFMNAIIAALPMKDIEALIFDKLSNSEAFQELYEKIASIDYKGLKEQALKHPEIIDLITRMKNMGVDIQKIIDFLKEFFGWEYKGYNMRSSRSLRTDLDELLALIPKDRIKEIYHEYENDPDIKKIVAYLKSKDFAAVVHIVAQVDEVKRLVNYLESKDIHVIEFLNKIADILGLPHWPGSFYISAWPLQTRTWRDFMNAIAAALPMKDIEALIFDKLSNSEDFQELYEKIASIDYKGLKEQALSHPEIVDLINRLKNMGVDIQKIIDFLKEFFGWE